RGLRRRGWHGEGDLSRAAGAQDPARRGSGKGREGCGEREVPEAGTGPAAGGDFKAPSLGSSPGQRIAGAGGPDQCHGASAPPALGEGRSDRAERKLHGDGESEKRVRVPRTRSADSV